jgi:large-conductance mechanosensitive channel
MTLLIRFVLITIIIYLLVRSFVRYFEEKDTSTHDKHEHDREKNSKSKGVSKEVGEYIDYEEVE